MAAKNWFEEFPAIIAEDGATGATGATRSEKRNVNKILDNASLLHLTKAACATGATERRSPVAPVAPVLHFRCGAGATGNSKPDQVFNSAVAPVAPVARANDQGLDLRFAYEERAAILEYDAGLSRPEAELRARTEVYGTDRIAETWPPLPDGWH